MKMNRVWSFPSANTFDAPPVAQFVKKYLYTSKISVDPFARNKRWATYTNDLNPETLSEYHMEAADFLEMLRKQDVQPDLVIFDPPYSSRQIKECYDNIGKTITMQDTQEWVRWPRERNLISELLSPNGVVLSFGWNSVGMGKERGYLLEELLLVCHGGGHNDTICIAERKVQHNMLSELREDKT